MNDNKKNKKRDDESKVEFSETFEQTSKSFKRVYSRFEESFIHVFRFISSWIDRILFNEKYGKLVAVCLATVIVLMVNTSSRGNIFSNNMLSAIDIKDVPVVTNISDSTYEVLNLPESVNVTITGDTSDVQYASKQTDRYQVLANLADLGEGTHEITFQPVNFSSRVEANISPNTAIVTIRKKVARNFQLDYDFINTNKMDQVYQLSKPVFDQSIVSVRASEDTLNQIASVKALIDVEGVKADFEQEARIVAYNFQGEQIKVDVVPERVNVKVKVSMPKKKVTLGITLSGKLPDNQAIESYHLDNDTITIYGPEDVLSGIDHIDVVVPVDKIKSDTSITVPIKLPSGVTQASLTKVNVSIVLAKSESRIIPDIPIQFQNLEQDMRVQNTETKLVNVRVEGTKPMLDELSAKDIEVIANLSGLDTAGKHTVQLSVRGKNRLIMYSIENKQFEVELTKGE